MSFDLALNRLDHDMVFGQLAPDPRSPNAPTKYSIWPIEGADKIAQEIKMNLLTFLGEWFLDETWGVPYLEDILIKNPRMSLVEAILREHIESVPDVEGITSFGLNWDRARRTLNINFACNTLLGPVKDSIKLQVFRPNV